MRTKFSGLAAVFAIAFAFMTALLNPAKTSANAIDDIGVDRFAHFGCSYVINSELQKQAKMSPFAATLTTIAIGAAKEQFIDSHFERGDFAADCAGAIFYEVKF